MITLHFYFLLWKLRFYIFFFFCLSEIHYSHDELVWSVTILNLKLLVIWIWKWPTNIHNNDYEVKLGDMNIKEETVIIIIRLSINLKQSSAYTFEDIEKC